jgi:hypothetical protein
MEYCTVPSIDIATSLTDMIQVNIAYIHRPGQLNGLVRKHLE